MCANKRTLLTGGETVRYLAEKTTTERMSCQSFLVKFTEALSEGSINSLCQWAEL